MLITDKRYKTAGVDLLRGEKAQRENRARIQQSIGMVLYFFIETGFFPLKITPISKIIKVRLIFKIN